MVAQQTLEASHASDCIPISFGYAWLEVLRVRWARLLQAFLVVVLLAVAFGGISVATFDVDGYTGWYENETETVYADG